MSSFRNVESLSANDQMLFSNFGKGLQMDVPFMSAHQAIEHFFDTQPEAIAADHNGATITYRELENAANILANRLIRNGVQPQQRICLVMQRSIPLVIAILAVLKCGCQYLPLDGGSAPDDTFRHILSDTAAKYVLCLSKFKSRVMPLVGPHCSIIVLDDSEEQKGLYVSTVRPRVDIAPNDEAYIIYTSGTIGVPKGVDVPHSAVTNLLCLDPGNLGIKPDTTVAQLLSISFDMGQWEILSTSVQKDTIHSQEHGTISNTLDKTTRTSIAVSVPQNLPLSATNPVHLHKPELITETIPDEKLKPTYLIELYPLPDKKGIHGLRALRHRFFTLYRRLLTTVLVTNLAAMFWMLNTYSSRSQTLSKLATATLINHAVAVLIRQEHVINALFGIFCSVPTWAPLFIRRNCARVFHIGGIHSGAAVASTLWFLLFTVTVTLRRDMPAVIGVSWTIIALLIAMLVTAHPTYRRRFHNRFEITHRFASWTVLALFWFQTILITDATRGFATLGRALAYTPGFWLLLASTASIILPWLTLRKVTVRAEAMSSHAVRLYFNFCTPAAGSVVRVSAAPLLEWHFFAAIPKPNETEFSLIVSKAGDWTSSMIGKPPTTLWVRGVPTRGVLCVAPLFKSIVLVATGSGIGPCLPLIYTRQIPMRILWSAPKPYDTFGKEVVEAVYKADKRAVVWDTKRDGRPDIVGLVWGLVKESGAEAVFVISNQKVTQLVVYGIESRGVAAFGAIFDS